MSAIQKGRPSGSSSDSRMLNILGTSQATRQEGSDDGSEEGAITPPSHGRPNSLNIRGSANGASRQASDLQQSQQRSQMGAARLSEEDEHSAPAPEHRSSRPHLPRTPMRPAGSHEQQQGPEKVDGSRSAGDRSPKATDSSFHRSARRSRDESPKEALHDEARIYAHHHAPESRRDSWEYDRSSKRVRREASRSPSAYSHHSRGEARRADHQFKPERHRTDRWTPERERHRNHRDERSSHRRAEENGRSDHDRRRDRYDAGFGRDSRVQELEGEYDRERRRHEDDRDADRVLDRHISRRSRDDHDREWHRRERERETEREYPDHHRERSDRRRGIVHPEEHRLSRNERSSHFERNTHARRSRSPHYQDEDLSVRRHRGPSSPSYRDDDAYTSRRQEQRHSTAHRVDRSNRNHYEYRGQGEEVAWGVRRVDREVAESDSSRQRAERRHDSPERTLSRKASSISLKAKASLQEFSVSTDKTHNKDHLSRSENPDLQHEPEEPAPPATPPPPSEQPPPPELLPSPPAPSGLVDEDGDVRMRDASAAPSTLTGARSVGARTSGWRTGAHTSRTNASSIDSFSPALFNGDAPNRHVKDDNVDLGPPTISERVRRRNRAQPVPLEHRTFKGCSPVDMYDVGQKLGQGTFGVVERAKHKVTGNDVAMKRVTIHDEKDGFPLTAIREIKLLKRLSHPAIVPVIDMAYRRFSDRRPREIYMIEPYMDHDLNGMLENPSISFTPSQMKLYMKQLLEGTLYMHQNKILHRDMKAANLLINNEGQLQIADFGLARPFRDPGHAWKRDGWKGGDAAQAYTEMVVTRWYRPPELLAGERKYGPPIDMWGLGCILAEMVIKGPLFKGTSEINQLELISQLCGSPNEKNYPGWNSLPGVRNARADGRPSSDEEPGRHDFGNHPRRVIEHFTKGPVNVRQELADLIDKLLVLDPRKRMTAEEALQHDWFWQTPYPALPTSLPRYEASKEIDRQQLREGRKRTHAPPARPPQPPVAMLPPMQAGMPRMANGAPTSMAFADHGSMHTLNNLSRAQGISHGQGTGPANTSQWGHPNHVQQQAPPPRAGAGAFMGLANGGGQMHHAGPNVGPSQAGYPQSRGPGPQPGPHTFAQSGLPPRPAFVPESMQMHQQHRPGPHPSRGYPLPNSGPGNGQLPPYQPPPLGRQRPQAYDYDY